MSDGSPEDIATYAIFATAEVAEIVLNKMQDLPPFGVAFFANGKRQTVAPFGDAQTLEQTTHNSLRTEVAKQLEAIVRQRNDVVAVTTVLADDGPTKVYIQLEMPSSLPPPLAFPVTVRDGRHDLGDPGIFEQLIAEPIFPR